MKNNYEIVNTKYDFKFAIANLTARKENSRIRKEKLLSFTKFSYKTCFSLNLKEKF